MTSLTLHKVDVYPDEEENHVFTFVLDSPQRLLTGEVKSVEGNEVNYGGHPWSVVCMRREDRHLGVFLKSRYADGNSSAYVSVKAKYSLTLIHRHDYRENKTFMTSQKFTSAQPLLGKTRFAALDEVLDQAAGYLEDTGRQLVIELAICRCVTRFEKLENVSPANRTRKNASGVYFDTTTFALAGHRWYIRFYATKVNSNGLPAVYLYLSSKAKGVALDVQFALFLGTDMQTEILTYSFGDGAKFDGFGKTLAEPLYNAEKLQELAVAVEITSVVSYKYAVVRLRQPSIGPFSPRTYKDVYNGSYVTGSSALNSTAAEPFQDHEGNHWKVDLVRDAERVTFTFDKAVHHFPTSRTKLLCWTAALCSRDPKRSGDVIMRGNPLHGYFSNLIDDKGYIMTFPLQLVQLEERGSPYVDDAGDILLRINFISLQTSPLGLRSGPKFDYQFKHLLLARQELQESSRNLQDMREMTASRASLSLLDDQPVSESSASSGQGGHGKATLYKSYDSLDALSTGGDHPVMTNGSSSSTDSPAQLVADLSRSFLADILNSMADQLQLNNSSTSDDRHRNADGDYIFTERDVTGANGVSSSASSTESGIVVDGRGGGMGGRSVEGGGGGDVLSLIDDARSSSVDLPRQKELVANLIKFIKRLPFLKISEIVESGSLGTGTTTRSRVDADLIIFSADIPRSGQSQWMSPLLNALKTVLVQANANQDPSLALPRFTDVNVTPRSIQLTCDGVDIDVMLTHDWNVGGWNGGYDAIYEASCKELTNRGRQWLALACARLQKKIICDQPNEVKELIKVVQHWRNCVQWKRTSHRPSSYLLSLLVMKAAEETKSFDIKKILQKVGAYILAPELRLLWTLFYSPDKYPVHFDPPTPLVRDPANPAFNVAGTLPYWGQLRTEYTLWMRTLGIPCSSMLGLENGR